MKLELEQTVGRIVGDVQGQVHGSAVRHLPHDAEAENVDVLVLPGHECERTLAGLQRDVERQILPDRRRRTPVLGLRAIDVDRPDDAGIKAAAGTIEARLRADFRRRPAFGTRDFRIGQITVSVALQAIVQSAAQCLVDRRVEGKAGQAEECGQGDAGREQ